MKIIYIIQHKNNFGDWIDHTENKYTSPHPDCKFSSASIALDFLYDIKDDRYPNWRIIGRMTMEFEVK